MLVEFTMVEQRYLAVRGVLDSGATVSDVAIRYGVNRKTLHRWLVRYASEGMGALADKSCKPDRCPHQTTPELEAIIVGMRRAHPGWGPGTILSKLKRERSTVPFRSAIYRCLARHGLIEPRPEDAAVRITNGGSDPALTKGSYLQLIRGPASRTGRRSRPPTHAVKAAR